MMKRRRNKRENNIRICVCGVYIITFLLDGGRGEMREKSNYYDSIVGEERTDELINSFSS